MLVGLVACSAAKLDHPAPARDLYQGQLYHKARAYVERHCAAWGILSAQHGLVLPDQELAPYDRTLRQLTRHQRADWAFSTGIQLRDTWAPPYAVYLVLAGSLYAEALGCMPAWYPLQGLGIGQQLGWLTRHLERDSYHRAAVCLHHHRVDRTLDQVRLAPPAVGAGYLDCAHCRAAQSHPEACQCGCCLGGCEHIP